MNFPDYFPNGCPPEDAKAIEILAYRICKNNPITHEDFLSYYELGKRFNGVNGYGVSLLVDLKEANTILAMPAHRRDLIAKGLTARECGVLKQTSSNIRKSHFTWWLYEKAEPEKHFEVLEVGINE